ncbi:hypothetical protein M408DRAFT_333985 [Serendipita vermifera MAFF 305830]|uniref:Uncharacterized protein n=1 Tax=Serendipita vermifera MAFF 305830 TaxID=933852 RepID=A0A0C3AK50_SERVB|nr:hypothetical protein M408DRAFT_333985 [Serendipita vermifera MAFF 305830]
MWPGFHCACSPVEGTLSASGYNQNSLNAELLSTLRGAAERWTRSIRVNPLPLVRPS